MPALVLCTPFGKVMPLGILIGVQRRLKRPIHLDLGSRRKRALARLRRVQVLRADTPCMGIHAHLTVTSVVFGSFRKEAMVGLFWGPSSLTAFRRFS